MADLSGTRSSRNWKLAACSRARSNLIDAGLEPGVPKRSASSSFVSDRAIDLASRAGAMSNAASIKVAVSEMLVRPWDMTMTEVRVGSSDTSGRSSLAESTETTW